MNATNPRFLSGPSFPTQDDRENFVYAGRMGDLRELEYFLGHFGDSHVNARNAAGTTALIAASAHRAGAAVTLLLDRGASVDTQDNAGNTALMWAVQGGSAPLTEALLAAGANPRLRNETGESAFDIAMRQGFEDIAHTLSNAWMAWGLRGADNDRSREEPAGNIQAGSIQVAAEQALREDKTRAQILETLKARAPGAGLRLKPKTP